MKRFLCFALTAGLGVAAFSGLGCGGSSSSSSKAAATAPFQHVLLISIDGMHSSDLDNYVKAHPGSTLAALSGSGTTYANAYTTKPSDSFPGILALTTGGTPYSTGIFYDDKWDRSLLPSPQQIAGGQANVAGTELNYAEPLDKGYPTFAGDPQTYAGASAIDPTALAVDPATHQPVWPHNHLRVNTIFEVAKAKGMMTAWCDKHPAYEMLNGPSGTGVTDLYTPEINAPVPGKTSDYTKSVSDCITNDTSKVNAVLNEIAGKDHTGTTAQAVPAIFGMNFQAVSVGQKLAGNGYTDSIGTPSAGLQTAMDSVDTSLGRMVAALKAQGLYASTLIIISAKHGQSPMDQSLVNRIDDGQYTSILAAAGAPEAFHIADDFCMIWLKDQSRTATAVAALDTPANRAALGIGQIYSGPDLSAMFQSPLTDSRTPDIIIQSNIGVIYTGGSKIAEHGGFSEDDSHVCLLLSYQGAASGRIATQVRTTQVAPSILHALGLDPNALQAVQQEGTPLLPGLKF